MVVFVYVNGNVCLVVVEVIVVGMYEFLVIVLVGLLFL